MSIVATELFRFNRPTTIPEVRESVIATLQNIKASNPEKEIWLVSGKVSPEKGSASPIIERRKNEASLRRTRTILQQESDNRIYFTSADIMPRIRRTITASQPTYQEFLDLWGDIVNSGYVDGVYMTENAHNSQGAWFEHAIALRRGLSIEYQPQRRRVNGGDSDASSPSSLSPFRY